MNGLLVIPLHRPHLERPPLDGHEVHLGAYSITIGARPIIGAVISAVIIVVLVTVVALFSTLHHPISADRRQRPGRTKAEEVEAVVRVAAVAVRSANDRRDEVPRAAPVHPVRADTIHNPGTAVIRGAVVVVVIRVLHPLPYVAPEVTDALCAMPISVGAHP